MVTQHAKFKELCLENGNPEAHYIEGFIKYFLDKEKHTVLRHLHKSASANYPNGMYLYGLLMRSRGHYQTGKKYLDKLQWKLDISTSDHCWENIKNALIDIPRLIKNCYHVNMVNLKPRCHPDNMAEICEVEMGTYLDFTKRTATFIERSADQINFVYNNSKEVSENRRRLSIYKGIVMSRQNAGIHPTIRVCLEFRNDRIQDVEYI
ncbi:Ribosomal protein L19 protein [Raphanus sativus]|nr:Ribosomal protein L19 protein [Raphanus sativus]